jgi:hypothetical protein
VKYFLLFAALSAFAQAPDCSIVAGSKQEGPARHFESDTLFEYMNGNSEGYFLYGFVEMHGITCKLGEATYIVDLSRFQTPELAFGMFTGNLDPRLASEKIGAGGQVVDRKVIFVKGHWFGEIAAEPEGQYAAALRKAALAWAAKLEGTEAAPVELGWFPKEKIQEGSPRLVPQSVLGLRILKRGYVAQYEQGKALIITEETDASAHAVVEKLKERFTGNTPAKVADESFTAEDKYLGRICFFRQGRRIAGWTNVPAGADPAEWAARLLKAMPAATR